MMRYSIIAIVLFISCTQNERKVIDINDIQAQSKNYKEGEIKSDTASNMFVDFPLNLDLALLSESGINCQDKSLSDSLYFPDRFSPITLNKFNYNTKDELINFSQFNFKDSTKTQNVFLNWINCFGSKCAQIGIGETKNLQKNGFLMMVNDTCIVYISANSTSEKKNWLNYFTQLKDIHWKYILNQNKHGKVTWQSYSNKSFTPITAIALTDEN